MALGIPLPGSNFESFDKGLGRGSEIMQRMMMNPYDMAQKKAETEKSNAEAGKAKMLTDLMQQHPELASYYLGLGEPPDVKRRQDYNQKEYEINQKALDELGSHAHALKTNWKELQRIRKALTDRPDLTGPGQGLMAKGHLSNDKALGEVIPAFGDIQANMAKSASSNKGSGTGIRMMDWAGRVKMDAMDPHEMNMGKVNALDTKMREDYASLAQQGEERAGRKMPTFKEFILETPEEQKKTIAAAIGEQPKAQGAPEQSPEKIDPQFADTIYRNMPPDMKKMADDAIAQGANREDVIREAMKQMGIEEVK